MPQHAPFHTPVVEFAGWLVSATWRKLLPLVDLAVWFGIALLDALERRTRWFRRRLRTRWRWQLGAAVVVIAGTAGTLASLP